MRNLSGLKLVSKKSIKTCDGCKKNEKVVEKVFLLREKKMLVSQTLSSMSQTRENFIEKAKRIL